METSPAEIVPEPECGAETAREAELVVPVGPPESSPARNPDRELRLVFADFTPALSESVLDAEAINPDAELIFDLQVIGDLIVTGRNTVPIAWLKERLPAFFRDEPLPPGGENMRFPWQKVLRLLATALTPTSDSEPPAVSGLTPAGANFLLSHFRTRRDEDRKRHSEAEAARQATVKKFTSAKDCANQPATLMRIESTSPTGVKVTKPEADAIPDDSELTADELRRQRDVARRELARLKGDLERRLAAVLTDLKTMTQERDKTLLALAGARQNENERYAQLEFEYAVQAKSLERALTDLQAARTQNAALQNNAGAAGATLVAAAPTAVGKSERQPAITPVAKPANVVILPPEEAPPRRSFLALLAKAALFIVFLGIVGVAAAVNVPAFAQALPESILRLAPPALGLRKALPEKEIAKAPVVASSNPLARSPQSENRSAFRAVKAGSGAETSAPARPANLIR